MKLGVCNDLITRYADPLLKLGIVRLNLARVLFLDCLRIQELEQVLFLFLVDEAPTLSVLCLKSPINAYHEMAERLRREPLALVTSDTWHTIDFPWVQSVFGTEVPPVEIDLTFEPRLLGDDPVANAIWTQRMAATHMRQYVVEFTQTDPFSHFR